MTKPLADQTPAEIDTELARIGGIVQRLQAQKNAARKNVFYYAQQGRMKASDRFKGQVEDIEAQIITAQAEGAPFEAEFVRRGGWLRYFLVTNASGHVHRGMDCQTCFASTQYAWLIDLADCNEDEMVRAYGEKACTVCFPDAPANPHFNGPGSRNREAINARQAEKAARQAAKDAKAITALDGSPLLVPYYERTEVVSTKIDARNRLSGAVYNLALYGFDHPARFAEIIETLVPVLKANGFDTAKVMAAALKRARKDAINSDYWFFADVEQAVKNNS